MILATTGLFTQSPIPTVLEIMVMSILDRIFKNIIVENQYGFVSGRSTLTSLFIYTNFVAKALDIGYEMHLIYTDFRKAFDLLHHNVFYKKIENYGIRDYFLSWL